MENVNADFIKQEIKKGTFDTALMKDDSAASFPSKDFSGLCYIRLKANPFFVMYRIRVNYNKPMNMTLGTTQITCGFPYAKHSSELNDLWNFISEIETKKRQKNKELSK